MNCWTIHLFLSDAADQGQETVTGYTRLLEREAGRFDLFSVSIRCWRDAGIIRARRDISEHQPSAVLSPVQQRLTILFPLSRERELHRQKRSHISRWLSFRGGSICHRLHQKQMRYIVCRLTTFALFIHVIRIRGMWLVRPTQATRAPRPGHHRPPRRARTSPYTQPLASPGSSHMDPTCSLGYF